MIVGQTVTCIFDYDGMPFLGTDHPILQEQLQIAEIKQVQGGSLLRFDKYDRKNEKAYFNSNHYQE